MASEDEIKAIVVAAFKPLRCVAEVCDYGQKLQFKVFDEKDMGILEEKNLVLRNLSDKAQLRGVLSDARQRLLVKGYRFDPWELK